MFTPSELKSELRIFESLNEDERQINNTAEMVAVIAALIRLETSVCKVFVNTDSKYVELGAGGGGLSAQMATKQIAGLQGAVNEREVVG